MQSDPTNLFGHLEKLPVDSLWVDDEPEGT
jgi:hypothetical protein